MIPMVDAEALNSWDRDAMPLSQKLACLLDDWGKEGLQPHHVLVLSQPLIILSQSHCRTLGQWESPDIEDLD